MKLLFSITFFLFTTVLFSQGKWSKVEEISFKEIIINGEGLDDLIIQNSEDNFLKISLDYKSYGDYVINTKQSFDQTEVFFKVKEDQFKKEQVFRKYITQRVSGASVIIEVPIGKSVVVYGEGLGVKSEGYKGDLSVYIQRGNIYLNSVEGAYNMSFFQGNLYGSMANCNMNLVSSKGRIILKGEKMISPMIQNKEETKKRLKVMTIRGNIFINSN
ncbi:hypothetical protein SAMN04489761_4718 [Tenacibaculum sp. MAR_2009_124]|uniref:hypothetical protein n=1 Tax=Tenacibaculum sp. MAR_2009_124 TaxID=1250059 RepID=UPI0008974113|nr:hypothetical protein [Tenacibaculum sp. MAR_2009_124]SED23478.1 hypothetical protein SAMN04489761_4718 [Tenacibaculum sp. MAR_2009_124]